MDDDAGWSDLDSDSEDLFYMTPLEVSTFIHNKAKAKLDAQHSLRLANLGSPSSSSSPSPCCDSEDEFIGLEKSQFDLMAKTARILSTSSNPAMLELKILANHGGDARFGFLRKDQDSRWNGVWEALKKCKGELGYEDALQLVQPNKTVEDNAKDKNKQGGGGLVAYEDSESESEPQLEAPSEEKTLIKPSENQEGEEDNEAKLKKQKQTERLARAKEWLKTRSKPPPPPPPPCS